MLHTNFTFKKAFIALNIFFSILTASFFISPQVEAGSVTPLPGNSPGLNAGGYGISVAKRYDPSDISNLDFSLGNSFILYLYPMVVNTAPSFVDVFIDSSLTLSFDNLNAASYSLHSQSGGTWDQTTSTWSFSGLSLNNNQAILPSSDVSFIQNQNYWIALEITAITDLDATAILSIFSQTTYNVSFVGSNNIFVDNTFWATDILEVNIDAASSDPTPNPDPTPDPDPSPIPDDPTTTVTLPAPTDSVAGNNSSTPSLQPGGLIRTGGSDY
jgi:hypothetical protein